MKEKFPMNYHVSCFCEQAHSVELTCRTGNHEHSETRDSTEQVFGGADVTHWYAKIFF